MISLFNDVSYSRKLFAIAKKDKKAKKMIYSLSAKFR